MLMRNCVKTGREVGTSFAFLLILFHNFSVVSNNLRLAEHLHGLIKRHKIEVIKIHSRKQLHGRYCTYLEEFILKTSLMFPSFIE